MKPLLSESGTAEISFGIFSCVVGALAGALHFVFGADEPGAFQSSALLAMGLGFACYGAILRRSWYRRARDQPEERRMQPPDKPNE
jgi:hypothetical protein